MKSPRFFGKPKKQRRLLIVRRVIGGSMLPSLRADQIVVGVRAATFRPGEVVIVMHNGLEKIKRIRQVRGRQVFIVGDNEAQSNDSRTFGWLPFSAVRAKIIWPRIVAYEPR